MPQVLPWSLRVLLPVLLLRRLVSYRNRLTKAIKTKEAGLQAPDLAGVQGWDLTSQVCISQGRINVKPIWSIVSPRKPVNGSVSQLPIIPPPIFYDKTKVDTTKGTLEVRILL